ncbi:MAG: Na+:solute symporter [Kiritimatiellae bacterium]|nr:Na+:solute symporter [Kiritimatiellia bacterium]
MRTLAMLDWAIIVAFLLSVIVIGAWAAKRASKSAEDFFLSGRSMPWWLLGVSMVACTFSCDTPNLVTDIVRTQGVAGNWAWWAFLLTGMLTVFVYAKLWRRSELSTDLGFYELRYSGAPAKALRGFRAVYLGLVFNVIIMGTVSLAAIKIGATIFGLTPVTTLAIALAAVGVYATLGGLTGSIWADFYQYTVAMVGAVAAAYFAVKMCGPDGTGTLSGVLSHAAVSCKTSMLPATSGEGWRSTLMTIFILPVAVQWWATWYPGAEPGGGGYIAQRMLSAKDEKNAVGAVMLFNFLHYALRSWPWLIVALASLIVFPDLESIKAAFPNAQQYVQNDTAYPAMISRLPSGWLGLVAASLIAAYMSTIATHLNWGASYLVQDFYVRFVNPKATPKNQVLVGRLCMLLLLVACGVMALVLRNAKGGFDLILQIGAGTGLLYILRWFWHRLNAWSEISAMVISFLVACFFEWGAPACGLTEWLESGWRAEWFNLSAWKLVLGVGATTAGWIAVTLLTPRENAETLRKFDEKIHADLHELPVGILCMLAGCLAVWSCLFGCGYLIYGFGGVANGYALGGGLLALSAVSTFVLMKLVGKAKLS